MPNREVLGPSRSRSPFPGWRSFSLAAGADALAQNIGADNLGATFTWKLANDSDPTQALTSLAEVEYFYPLLPV